MINRNDLFHLSFYKKTHFTGSFQGMRYYITKAKESGDEDAADVLRAIVYPEPYNFENTPAEEKTHADFPFTEDDSVNIMDTDKIWRRCEKAALR